MHADIVIVGGGVGGCAAALAALESGCTVILTEETDWLGGQLTSQLAPPDEHGWIERFGCTASYRQYRDRVRSHYREHYPLLPEVRSNPRLNPGNGWVSPLCHEPRVALAVLDAMMAPHLRSGRLAILREHVPAAVSQAGADILSAVLVENRRDGSSAELSGRFVIDATETGELLELSGAEHVTGQEGRADTGEPSAPAQARPGNTQAFSWCFVIEHIDGENHVGAAPEGYERWARYQAPIRPPWPGPWLGWQGTNPRTMEPVRYRFDPHRESPGLFAGLWSYRRIIDRDQFIPGAFASDVVVVNWPMNDYLEGSLIGGTKDSRRLARTEARQLSLSLLHWMRTEAPRPDGGRGWPGLRLRPEATGTADGFAKAPYVRESRRIAAECTIREQDVSAALLPHGANRAREFADSVGVGYYRIDLHPTHGGDNYIDVPALPFQIPLGALIPVRMENLLPAAKNIGTTHITNGCYRLHPIEWNIGEAAGALAAFCLRHHVAPRAVRRRGDLLERFRADLRMRGLELDWPADIDLCDGDPHAHVMRK